MTTQNEQLLPGASWVIYSGPF